MKESKLLTYVVQAVRGEKVFVPFITSTCPEVADLIRLDVAWGERWTVKRWKRGLDDR